MAALRCMSTHRFRQPQMHFLSAQSMSSNSVQHRQDKPLQFDLRWILLQDSAGEISLYAAALDGQPATPTGPGVTQISPTSGGLGTNVTISGTGFGPGPQRELKTLQDSWFIIDKQNPFQHVGSPRPKLLKKVRALAYGRLWPERPVVNLHLHVVAFSVGANWTKMANFPPS